MQNETLILGLMSGTSMDGLDIALCKFTYTDDKWRYEIIAASCINYSDEWLKKLNTAHNLNGLDLIYAHKEYGFYLAGICNEFLEKHGQKPELIASHGHTIFHDPARHISFQLGDGAAIAAKTGIAVVSDFRALDVCLGGQGAPLVPIGDELLFPEYDFCLNLGGIANISYSSGEIRYAYDVCPCNIILNQYAAKAGHLYDKDGALASSGSIDTHLMEDLKAWSYYNQKPPKSLDKNTLKKELIPVIDSHQLNIPDTLATLSAHIGDKLITEITLHKQENATILVTGGGAFNCNLIDRLQSKAGLQFVLPDAQLINYKEALIFAFLGLLRFKNIDNTLASVTGAERNSCGGALYIG